MVTRVKMAFRGGHQIKFRSVESIGDFQKKKKELIAAFRSTPPLNLRDSTPPSSPPDFGPIRQYV